MKGVNCPTDGQALLFHSAVTGHPLHMLRPGPALDDDMIQVDGSISSVLTQYPVHKVLESGRGSEQAERKCDELVQTLRSEERRFFPRLCRKGNLPVALGKSSIVKSEQCLTCPGARQPGARDKHQTVTPHSSCDSPHRTIQTHLFSLQELWGYIKDCPTLLLLLALAFPQISFARSAQVTCRAINTQFQIDAP